MVNSQLELLTGWLPRQNEVVLISNDVRVATFVSFTSLESSGILPRPLLDAFYHRFSYGYCHYDYLPKNFHFDEHDRLTLFDFDFAGNGLLANDLASFSIHLFFNVFTGKTSREVTDREMRVCLDAYREVRPLLDEAIEAIPYLGVAFFVFYLGFQYENFDDWSNFLFRPG